MATPKPYKIILHPYGCRSFDNYSDYYDAKIKVERVIDYQSAYAPHGPLAGQGMEASYELYENGVLVYKSPVWDCSSTDYLDNFGSWMTESQRKEIRGCMPGCLRFVAFCLFLVFGFFFIKCNDDIQDKSKQRDKDDQWEAYMNRPTYGGYGVERASAVYDDNGKVVEEIPEWTNHGGDKEACRKDLIHRMKVLYGKGRADNDPERIRDVYMKGKDTLIIESGQFRELAVAIVFAREWWQVFEDCGFAKVSGYYTTKGWVLYEKGMEKPCPGLDR